MALVAGSLSLGLSAAAQEAAQNADLAMLSELEPGAWDIRFRGAGEETRRVCMRTGLELIQLRHSESNCNRFVVEDGAQQVTVQYTCRGNGYGRTNVRRESNTLVQIQSQGIEGGAPFEFSAEARRVSSC